ncbi:MoxR family ATPase [Alicyclobacillus cycloheptanicus]|uniref:MoxR-like ATPase n=1 Tax=Alicyclobacillus cycloheptanicus TaxID=1457 RepID=A0ABT9XGN5_9BACL|nr:MoxR family ATPase [Alicyclobacillus cycloheptanicus]MDQ0189435.1 MoxR-like ATPase [Alicyclobacillus cycloheptanicus]WDM02305.1 MoxR family ATPase [Alicyclobacillus cycloheptanicus]
MTTVETAAVDQSFSAARETIESLRRQIGARLFGVEHAVDALLIALMARGHILLEDVPGVGKTELAKQFAASLGLSFRRIQCTPDLMPADVLGGLVFHPKDGEFHLRKGPIFANLLLVDELNRALPRTQSALLEAMAEGHVTLDGETLPLPEPFLVIATQNPIESQGVFPLPEAQVDRFLLRTKLGYPPVEQDTRLLRLHLQLDAAAGDSDAPSKPADAPLNPAALDALYQAVARVQVHEDILTYISRLVQATRSHPDVEIGASPRAMVMLAAAARAHAVLAHRTFVIPDDVQQVIASVFLHRLVFQGHMEFSGTDPEAWLKQLVESVEVPIERDIV